MTLFAENAKDNKCICESFIEKNKRVVELEKENAELKERLERAKEIIKDFYDRDDSCWSIQKKSGRVLGGGVNYV